MSRRQNLVIRAFEESAPGSQPVEVVERKGLGHPDTLCDAIAERICVRHDPVEVSEWCETDAARPVVGERYSAACLFVSQIGRPVDDPQVVDVKLVLEKTVGEQDVRANVERTVRDQLDRLHEGRDELLQERVLVY